MPPTVTNESTFYRLPRLPSFRGYNRKPVTDDCFLFTLPPFSRYVGRDVEMSDGKGVRRWELWSPNSIRKPFYPGSMIEDNYTLEPPSDLQQRRFDGHLGRFDPTVSPQHYLSSRPWLAFMPLPDLDLVDSVPIYRVWQFYSESDPRRASDPCRGSVSQAFIQELASLSSRLDDRVQELLRVSVVDNGIGEPDNIPTFPTPLDIDRLSTVITFEYAVDFATYIQRGLKNKAAWIAMAEKMVESWPPDLEQLSGRPIPPANDRLLGVWLNGLCEEMCLWFLIHAQVPCFIVHDYKPGKDFPIVRRAKYESDNRNPPSLTAASFISGTLLDQPNRYDLRARKGGCFTADFHETCGVESPPFNKHRVLSSSWAQYWDRRTGRYVGPAAALLASSSSQPSSTSKNGLSTVQRPAIIPSGGPSTSGSSVVECPPPAARPLETVVIAPERVPWVRPPVIIGVDKGTWTHFYEDLDVDDTLYLVEGSKVTLSRYYITLIETKFLCKF
jgi:hypothetical protein